MPSRSAAKARVSVQSTNRRWRSSPASRRSISLATASGPAAPASAASACRRAPSSRSACAITSRASFPAPRAASASVDRAGGLAMSRSEIGAGCILRASARRLPQGAGAGDVPRRQGERRPGRLRYRRRRRRGRVWTSTMLRFRSTGRPQQNIEPSTPEQDGVSPGRRFGVQPIWLNSHQLADQLGPPDLAPWFIESIRPAGIFFRYLARPTHRDNILGDLAQFFRDLAPRCIDGRGRRGLGGGMADLPITSGTVADCSSGTRCLSRRERVSRSIHRAPGDVVQLRNAQ